MKKIKALTFICMATVCLSSCTNWLDMKPFDQTLDDDLYSTERGIGIALNGLYLSMADANLYGKNLTYYSTELLGQRYRFAYVSNATFMELGALPAYTYTDDAVKSHLDKIFAKAYNVIRDANFYIAKIEDTNVVSAEKKNLLLGEGYALRAFLHFDMLRFYGYPPVLDNKGEGIPFYTEATNEWQPILTNGEVLKLILKDIDIALNYLKDDPILTKGVITDGTTYDFFNVHRNHRLNYLAVKALKARVLFYAADAASVAKAGQIAVELIESDVFQKAFPWIDVTETDPKKLALTNHIYTNEVMFGIEMAKLHTDWDKWFNIASIDNYGILQTTDAVLTYMFQTKDQSFTTSTDPRAKFWKESNLSSTADKMFLSTKFLTPTGSNSDLYKLYKDFMPLMRKSEIYLIAAEITGDSRYVNEIRKYRGLNTLELVDPGFDLQEQIRKEYMKDFMGEGQLFYYYKRRAETRIRGMWGIEITVDPKTNFVPPMPKDETEV